VEILFAVGKAVAKRLGTEDGKSCPNYNPQKNPIEKLNRICILKEV
jgi:hypothetical protein